MLIEIFGYLQFLFYNLELILERLIQAFILHVFGLEATVAVAARVVLTIWTCAGTIKVAQQRTDAQVIDA